MNWLFAWRYFKSKKSTNAINVIAWVSVTAITVVTAAFIIILSVYNGIEGLVKGMYADFYADIKITPTTGQFFNVSQQQLQKIQQQKNVQLVCKIVEEKALLVNDTYQSIVYVKGVDENYVQLTKLSNYLVHGKYNIGTADAPNLILGAGVENALAADVQTSINGLMVYLPNTGNEKLNLSSADAFNSAKANAVATFLVQQEFDNKYTFTNIAFMQYMLNLPLDTYSALELKLTNTNQAEATQHALQKLLGNNVKVETRYQQNKSLYRLMQLERWFIYAILVLVLIIASFNIVGALTMLVIEKKKDIQILKALGSNNDSIQKIYLYNGILLALIGGIIGMLLAFIICYIQLKFKLIGLGGGSFVINYYPVTMKLSDFGLAFLTISVIAFLAAYFPSQKASKQSIELKS